MSGPPHACTAILPCNDLARSRTFYERLGFQAVADHSGEYVILEDGRGAELHLQPAAPGWLDSGRNPFGLYLNAQNVDELAANFAGEIIEAGGRPEDKPWGMYEFSLSDPDQTLVRVGRRSESLRR